MENKRTLTKAGSILGIVAWSINILVMSYSLFIVFLFVDISTSLDSEVSSDGLILLFRLIFNIAISIVLIVMSAKTIKASNKDVQTFVSKRSIINFAAVVNIINACYCIYNVICSSFSIIDLILDIVICALLLVSGILILVDLSKANKLLQTLPQSIPEQQVQNTEQQVETKSETIEDKLEKLNKMKENGLISEEEYEKLKKDLLK